MRPQNKSALITGGAKRIGRAITLDLARNGFSVAIHCGRSREEAQRLADQIKAEGGQACIVQADLTCAERTREIVAEAESDIGSIGLLVNNASVFEEDEVTDFSDEVWDRHFALHVKAPAILAGSFARALGADQGGLIVNMIDQRVWKPTPRFFSYTLSKSALWTATRTMAQALAPRIRVNAIGPGPTLPDKHQGEEGFRRETKALPLGHGPDLSEFGATIRYLWDVPSVTGQMIALDGGKHIAWQTPDDIGTDQ
ncbi:SDR family oxidoreductase [Chelativorans sp. Marseille-P2723]|uniref:SDR family oxidoreductase n=1 Tax=Chelativorans sp. Marseille-P2723 TaxID=2709133 RepID=UPI00156DA1AE|nr:SDR family oxidoreductase [Chelativorans sp. Marseille-P2723]